MLPRSRELLHEIVAAYRETGEPVASRSIARRHGDPKVKGKQGREVRRVRRPSCGRIVHTPESSCWMSEAKTTTSIVPRLVVSFLA